MGQHAPPTLDRSRGGEGAERQRNPHHIHNGLSNRGIGETCGALDSQEAPPPAALSSVWREQRLPPNRSLETGVQ